ncbi:hypothetical protein GmHk_13G036089 [Glycine max]|nr:hypothetical protein GmHk_13G036089 [Glycine max]
MNTGPCACFLCQSFNFFVFLSLLRRCFLLVFLHFGFRSVALGIFVTDNNFRRQQIVSDIWRTVSIFISKLHEHRFVFLLSLSKVKYFCVPEPSPTLLSLDFLAFWVQICSIEYLCDQQQQRRQQIVSGIWRTGL